jgi:hypothetical protein
MGAKNSNTLAVDGPKFNFMQRSDSVQGIELNNQLSPKTVRMRNHSTIGGTANMSISDYTGVKKTGGGMNSYKTPSNEMMLSRPL